MHDEKKYNYNNTQPGKFIYQRLSQYQMLSLLGIPFFEQTEEIKIHFENFYSKEITQVVV